MVGEGGKVGIVRCVLWGKGGLEWACTGDAPGVGRLPLVCLFRPAHRAYPLFCPPLPPSSSACPLSTPSPPCSELVKRARHYRARTRPCRHGTNPPGQGTKSWGGGMAVAGEAAGQVVEEVVGEGEKVGEARCVRGKRPTRVGLHRRSPRRGPLAPRLAFPARPPRLPTFPPSPTRILRLV